jgi:hypothetical protein
MIGNGSVSKGIDPILDSSVSISSAKWSKCFTRIRGSTQLDHILPSGSLYGQYFTRGGHYIERHSRHARLAKHTLVVVQRALTLSCLQYMSSLPRAKRIKRSLPSFVMLCYKGCEGIRDLNGRNTQPRRGNIE